MKLEIRKLALGMVIASSGMVGVDALALDGTVAQNSAWNIQRAGAEDTLRIVAYGDSIVAGYTSPTEIAERSSTHVAAEYAAVLWGQNIEVRRRAQSGAVASAIYNRIINDTSFMQTDSTVGVQVVMCGNDYLQARSAFAGQTGQCNFDGLAAALDNCLGFTSQAIDYVNQNAGPNAKLKIVGNLYYPGFDDDNVMTQCTSPDTGQPLNRRDDVFLSIIAESNWETCNMAVENGWVCADNFAEFMTADFDSNGDGMVDSDAVRFVPGEPLEDYVDRILAANAAGLLRDANFKQISPGATVGYLLSDDTHTTFIGPTAKAGATGGSPGGNVNVFHPTDVPFPDFQNPDWNLNGHDRMGSALATNYDLNVDAGADATLFACEDFNSTVSFNDRVFFGPWPVFVDFGDGNSLTTEVSDMSLDISNQFTVPGTHVVNAVVTGAYDTVWHDSALVNVLSAVDGLMMLIDDFNQVGTFTTMNRRWLVESQGHLQDALDAAELGNAGSAEQSLDLFLQNLAQSSTAPTDIARLNALADQTLTALNCQPAGRTSRAGFNASRPFSLPQRSVVPQGRMRESRWIEFDGVRYSPDDPRLHELQLEQLEQNLELFLGSDGG
jgi:lysophospholipase L1-like esterase